MELAEAELVEMLPSDQLRIRLLYWGQLLDTGSIVGRCGFLYEEATGMWLARHR